jgi:hypothetical protein
LKDFQLDEISQIIALADCYEAMTHQRTYRSAIEEVAVIYDMLGKDKKLFHPRVLKGLVSFVSMYPPGSLVKLSNGNIARVIYINRDNILKPTVKVIMDSNFKDVEPFNFNLISDPLISINGYVSNDELKYKNSKFFREEELRWLWINW